MLDEATGGLILTWKELDDIGKGGPPSNFPLPFWHKRLFPEYFLATARLQPARERGAARGHLGVRDGLGAEDRERLVGPAIGVVLEHGAPADVGRHPARARVHAGTVPNVR